MRDIPVPLREGVDLARIQPQVESTIELCCREMELVSAMKTTLRKHPGCVHWHLRKPKLSGTLEITLWPAQQRLWIGIQDRRRAGWIEETYPALVECIRRRIEGLTDPSS